MNSVIRLLVIISLAAPAISHAQKAEMPAPTAFRVGDAWVWQEVDNRTQLEDGKPTRTVVKVNGILKFSDGTINYRISNAFLGQPSLKPWRVWPLEVGKQWVSDGDWVRADGVTGNTKQDAKVMERWLDSFEHAAAMA